MMMSCLVAATAWFGTAVSLAVEPAKDASDEIAVGEWLVIKPVGRSGRSAVHVDAIEALIVAAKWSTPKAGESITIADGTTRTWEAVKAAADGLLRHEALNGGYACWRLPDIASCTLMASPAWEIHTKPAMCDCP
jgi:hypothetical protein